MNDKKARRLATRQATRQASQASKASNAIKPGANTLPEIIVNKTNQGGFHRFRTYAE
jgi:glutaredoxin